MPYCAVVVVQGILFLISSMLISNGYLHILYRIIHRIIVCASCGILLQMNDKLIHLRVIL